jgi:hypothetical protein
MPVLERSDLKQRAVLWPKVGYDTFGQPAVGPPQEIPVRWSWTHRESIDAQGNTISIDADVVTTFPLVIGSHLWLGTLNDWNLGSGQTNYDMCECKTVPDTPDIKGRVHRYTGQLMRLHDLPGD